MLIFRRCLSVLTSNWRVLRTDIVVIVPWITKMSGFGRRAATTLSTVFHSSERTCWMNLHLPSRFFSRSATSGPSKVASLYFQKLFPGGIGEPFPASSPSPFERDENREKERERVMIAREEGMIGYRSPRHVAPAARRFSLFSTYKVRNTEEITCPLSLLHCWFVVLLFIFMIEFRDTAIRSGEH